MKIAVNVPVLIPTYNPTERIIEVVRSLISAGFERLIIVDDGSRPECSPIFAALADMPQCTLLHHDVNRGKGRGLKTGFAYILEHMPECSGVVTTDDDGQHSPEDILRCAEKMEQSGRAVLGARDFTGDDVPPRSRFGNNCTRFVFRALCGIRITDTQTGLRALPISYLPALAKLSGERFEYETNMLLYCKRHHIPMAEVPISTIYIEDNAGSHYHPVRDSLRIGLILCRCLLTSAAGLLAGLAVFWYFTLCVSYVPFPPLPWIWMGLISSYFVSGLIVFSSHHTDASQSGVDMQRESSRYSAVTALQCILSGLLLSFLDTVFPAVPLLPAKAVLDCVLFPCFSRLQDRISFSQALAEVRRVPVLK